MAVNEVTPWTWIEAAMNCLATMPYWKANGIDRTPKWITPGMPNAWLDQCTCDGQLTVTAGEVYYQGESALPERGGDPPYGAFVTDRWAVPITVQYGRCRPTADEAGNLSQAAIHRVAPQLHADAWAVWEALFCCIPTWRQKIAQVAMTSGPVPLGDMGTACAAWSYEFVGIVSSCKECPQ